EPSIAALRDRVSVDFQPGWPHAAAEMWVTLRDGRVLEARHDAGVPAVDVAAQRQRITGKFHALAAPVIGARCAEGLARAVARLDSQGSLGEITRLCVPA